MGRSQYPGLGQQSSTFYPVTVPLSNARLQQQLSAEPELQDMIRRQEAIEINMSQISSRIDSFNDKLDRMFSSFLDELTQSGLINTIPQQPAAPPPAAPAQPPTQSAVIKPEGELTLEGVMPSTKDVREQSLNACAVDLSPLPCQRCSSNLSQLSCSHQKLQELWNDTVEEIIANKAQRSPLQHQEQAPDPTVEAQGTASISQNFHVDEADQAQRGVTESHNRNVYSETWPSLSESHQLRTRTNTSSCPPQDQRNSRLRLLPGQDSRMDGTNPSVIAQGSQWAPPPRSHAKGRHNIEKNLQRRS